jgi:hypothetical protein
VIIVAVVAVLAVGVGIIFLVRPEPKANSGAVGTAKMPPHAAITTIQELTSASPAVQHRALTPELNSVLSKGRLFPAGTTFTSDSGSWHQSGNYANVTGTIDQPGSPPVKVEIGLVLREGHWLVTFEGQL